MKIATRIPAALAAAVLAVGMFAAAPPAAADPELCSENESCPDDTTTALPPCLSEQRVIKRQAARLDRKNDRIAILRKRLERLRG